MNPLSPKYLIFSLLFLSFPPFAQGKSQIQEESGTVLIDAYTILPFVLIDSGTISSATINTLIISSRATSGNITFNPTTAGIVGTTTNDSAPAGTVGEYISSNWNVTFPATGVFADATSITLTAGDWDVELHGEMGFNEVANVTREILGVSTTSGNSSSGLTQGTTRLDFVVPGTNSNGALTLGRVRFSVASSTIVYAKISSNFTGTTPTGGGIISARRIR